VETVIAHLLFDIVAGEISTPPSRASRGAPYTATMAVFARRLAEGRRRFVRVNVGVAVEFSAQADDLLFSMDGIARDISLGGMFVETDIPCLFGERIIVYATLPGRRRRMALSATVRWTSSAGMGVQFGLLGALDTHEIAEFTRE
jgi:hypothetical protein